MTHRVVENPKTLKKAGSALLLAALLLAPVFAAEAASNATTMTTTTKSAPSVQTYDDAGTVMTSRSAHTHGVHHKHHKHHHRVVTNQTSPNVYAPAPGYDEINMRRRQLWHAHYVIEAERQSLKIACMNVKGQDRSDCNEKWEDVRAQQDRLMAEVTALDKRAGMSMRQPRECMATPGHKQMAHCGNLPHDHMMGDEHYDHVAVATPLPRPSATAIPPITTPNAIMGQE